MTSFFLVRLISLQMHTMHTTKDKCYFCTRLITDRVRSTREGYVLTRVCPSIHPSVCPHLGGGGTPARFSPPRVPPTSGHPPPPVGPGRGYPTSGTPPPSDLAGGYPDGGVPHLPPPSDLAGGGYPTSGST